MYLRALCNNQPSFSFDGWLWTAPTFIHPCQYLIINISCGQVFKAACTTWSHALTSIVTSDFLNIGGTINRIEITNINSLVCSFWMQERIPFYLLFTDQTYFRYDERILNVYRLSQMQDNGQYFAYFKYQINELKKHRIHYIICI